MKATDWIKVTDELPQNYETDILVYDDREGVIIADYDESHGFSHYERGYLENVTHWMPLVLPED